MMGKVLDAPGTVAAAEGCVLISGHGHPVATYTPTAAAAMAKELVLASERAVQSPNTEDPVSDKLNVQAAIASSQSLERGVAAQMKAS